MALANHLLHADNIASQMVILANAGRLAEQFVAERFGKTLKHRYFIDLK